MIWTIIQTFHQTGPGFLPAWMWMDAGAVWHIIVNAAAFL